MENNSDNRMKAVRHAHLLAPLFGPDEWVRVFLLAHHGRTRVGRGLNILKSGSSERQIRKIVSKEHLPVRLSQPTAQSGP